MKNRILIVAVSLLTLFSCKKDLWRNSYYEYVPDTFSFTQNEMEVEVYETTKSFMISATKEDTVRIVSVGVDYPKSSALINKHYKMPQKEYQGYGFLFPAEKKNISFEVEVVPKNIKEPVVIVFCIDAIYNDARFNINSNPEKYIDTLRVKLIPMTITES